MLREEKIRLLTFIEVYSKLKRSAVILAALGFSYIRGNESHQEGIQCYFCHVFYPIDVEDLAHDPDCCMINENASGNIPYQTDRQFCSNFSELCANINTETEFINVAADSRHSENRLINIYNNQSQSENSLKSARCSYFNEFKNANSYLIEQPITCTDYGQSANSIKLDPECTSRQQGLQSREINVLGSVSTPVNPANAPAYLTPEANQRSLTSIKQTQPTGTNHAQQEPAANRPAGRRPGHTPTYSELGIITERPKRNDYALKIKRLESFESWPRGHHLTPNELADAGFYYAVSQTQPTGTNHAQQEPAANRPGRRPGHTPTYSELGIITERPKRNDYALKIKRLESFESWPRGHHLTPNELADAGFYYAGYGDCARCFYCGGGLRNWEDEDNVWVEHARWFPKCAFIRQQMGQMFVDTVKGLNEDRDQITYDMVMEKMREAGHTFNLENKENPLMKDPAVRTVVDMGYTMKDALQVAMIVKEEGSIMSSDTLLEKLEQQKIQKVNTTKATPLAITYDNDETQFALPSSSQTERSSNGAQQLALTNGDEGMQVALIDPSSGQVAARDVYTSSDKIFEMIRAIKESNNQLRQQTVCKICMDKEVAVVFLPCGHLVSCGDCAVAMRDCPVCRVNVKGIVRAFIA